MLVINDVLLHDGRTAVVDEEDLEENSWRWLGLTRSCG